MADDRFPSSAVLNFCGYRLDLNEQQLARGERLIPLRRKSWEVLSYLAQRPGTLVTTGELFDALWPGTAVTPAVLTNVISEIRTALADRGSAPRIIATVHRRGYRFIAECEALPARASAAPARAATPAAEPARAAELPLLVGREAQLHELLSRWQLALRGRRQLVFLSGEAGIGKTTLITHLVEAARVAAANDGCRIAPAACVEHYSVRESYLPILEMLEAMAFAEPALVPRLRQFAPTWLAQIPALLPADEMQALRLSLAGGGGERMLREGAALFDSLADDRPLLLVIEDLHWTDAATLDLISACARRTQPARLMLAMSYRPIDALVRNHPVHALARELHRQRVAHQMVLPPFSPSDVEAYLERRFGQPIAGQLVAPLERHSGGNALFVAALADQLVESGRLRQSDGGWQLCGDDSAVDIELPDQLRTAIEGQLTSLAPSLRRTLEAAAIEGEEFSARGVAAATDRTTLEVEDALHDLAAQQHLVTLSTQMKVWPDGDQSGRYHFRHALYRQALLEGITPSQRHTMHRKIGECLEAAYGERTAEIAGTLLAHFEACDDVERRVRYRMLIGTAAATRFAYDDALAHLEEALSQLQRLPETREHLLQRAQLELTLGNTLILAAGAVDPRVAAAFRRAEAAGQAAAAPRKRFRALLGLTGVLIDSEGVPALAAAVQQMRELAPQLPTLEAQVWWRDAELELWRGNFLRARECFERSVDAPGESNIPTLVDFRSVAAVRCSSVLTILGELDAAQRMRSAALQRAEDLGSPFNQCLIMWIASVGLALELERAAAATLAQRCREIKERFAFASFHEIDIWSALLAKPTKSDGRRLESLIEDNSERLGYSLRTYYLALLSERYLAQNDPGAAIAALARAEEHSRRAQIAWYSAEIHRLAAEARQLLLPRTARRPKSSAPQIADVEECFRKAIAIARSQNAKLWELRAAVGLSRFLKTMGRAEEGRAAISAVLAQLSASSTAPDVAAAHAELG